MGGLRRGPTSNERHSSPTGPVPESVGLLLLPDSPRPRGIGGEVFVSPGESRAVSS